MKFNLRRIGAGYMSVEVIEGSTKMELGILSPDECEDLALELRDAAQELDPLPDRNETLDEVAPDLLEALIRLSSQCDRLRLSDQSMTDAENNAHEVIAKATGGEV